VAVVLGPLAPLLADPTVSEVMVHAGRHVWVERQGRLEAAGLELTAGTAEALIERIVAPLGLRADRSAPIVDARLPDGSRVHAVLPPVALDGPSLCIRRFAPQVWPLAAFGPPAVVERLQQAVTEARNIVVSGSTSSGKTSLLGTLAGELPVGDRVLTIEDAAELRLPGRHVVRLEARPATADGFGAIDVRTLVRAALRMRPDRLVIGEVRGAEVIDMLLALSTGHDGCLSTIHATAPSDALRRIEALVLSAEPGFPLLAVRELVHAAVDVIVHVGRGSEGARRVLAIAEVVAPDELGRGRPRTHDALVAGFTRPGRRP
jgi:pilus assembly protein CpaF